MLSVILITKNEEHNIRECLGSVKWADEIIVVDGGSSDNTVDIAKEFSALVFSRSWDGYGAAKNYALSKCNGDWILWIDADERVTPELQKEMKNVLASASPDVSGFSMPRRANFLGRWIDHCGWYPGRVTRLFRKKSGIFTEDKVHERLEIRGSILELTNDLLHYTDPDLLHYYDKFNRYTSLAAEELNDKNIKFSLTKLILNPVWIFVKMYVLKLGFMDGIPGLILCTASSHYVFTKYAKHWEKSGKRKEL